ncbi:MAG: hypothetical protein J0I30_00725 [Burkholderiales bacterium]|nr:hypothetical protein [Burkholderiales bacterium]
MNQILTGYQAKAAFEAMFTLTAAEGRVTRLMFTADKGHIRVRQLRNGGILVLRINERDTVVDKNFYSSLADFAARTEGSA